MSADDNVEIKPERNSLEPPFRENKRKNYDIGEAGTSFLKSDAEDELLQKYKNISTSELEDICERLMYYDSTGIYKPLKQNKPCLCPKRKKSNKNQHTNPRPDSEKIETKFGQGSIGVATKRFGLKSACLCCADNFVMPQTYLVHPNNHLVNKKDPQSEKGFESPQVKVEKMDTNFFGASSGVPSDNNICNSVLLTSFNSYNNLGDSKSHLLAQKDPQSTQNSTPVLQSKTKYFSALPGTSTDNFVLNSVSSNCDNSVAAPQGHLLTSKKGLEKGPQSSNSSGNFCENFVNKMADTLSTCEFQTKTESFPTNPVFSNEELDQFSAFLDNANVLDLSVSNFNQSDSSDTIFYSEDSCSSLLNGVPPPPEAEEESPLDLSNDLEPQNVVQNLSQDDVSVISVSDVTAGPENNTEIVDLTNLTPSRPITTTEVIELLDDSFRNPNPPIVETIDLVESSDEDEPPKISSPVPGTSQSNVKKPSLECPICFESLQNKKIMTTICGHIFCSSCIKSAIRRKKCCPSCRKKLRANDFHPLYINL